MVGTWLTEDDSSKVEIGAAKGADGSTPYGGKMAWLKAPTRDGRPALDANNSNVALSDQPMALRRQRGCEGKRRRWELLRRCRDDGYVYFSQPSMHQ